VLRPNSPPHRRRGQWLPVAHADIDDVVRVNDGNPVPVCAVLVPDDPALSAFPPTAPAGWRFAAAAEQPIRLQVVLVPPKLPSTGRPGWPSDRHPHCAWTVTIDESYPPAEDIPALDVVRETNAARWELDAVDRSDEGLADYSGPLVSDLDFGSFSHSALVRMADEVCLQMHLLYLSFAIAIAIAVRARAGADAELAVSVGTVS